VKVRAGIAACTQTLDASITCCSHEDSVCAPHALRLAP
jgi:hypothetical protein